MDSEKNSALNEFDKQIDGELERRTDLLMENSKVNEAVDAIVNHKVLNKKLELGIPLTEEDLDFLQLDPSVKQAYLQLQNENQRTPQEILLEHLRNKNSLITKTNQEELGDIELNEKIKEKSFELLKSFDDTENSWLDIGSGFSYKTELVDKLLLDVAQLFEDDRLARINELRKVFNKANPFYIDAKSLIKKLYPTVLSIITSPNNEKVIQDIDRVIKVVESHNYKKI